MSCGASCGITWGSCARTSACSGRSGGSTCCKQEIHDYYSHFRVSNDLIELRNLVHVAELIVRSALARPESRGLNYNLDHPNMLQRSEDTILFPGYSDRLDVLQPAAS